MVNDGWLTNGTYFGRRGKKNGSEIKFVHIYAELAIVKQHVFAVHVFDTGIVQIPKIYNCERHRKLVSVTQVP